MQNDLKLPGFSGIVTAKIASLFSPISVRSEIYRSLSKLIFAPHSTASKVFPFTPVVSTYFFNPAKPRAPVHK